MIQNMQIGKSDVRAPKLTLGTFGMGGGTSWQDTTKDDNELIEMIRQAHDEYGINSIDTAPVYGTGRSEKIIAEAIKGHREDYFIATKCSLNWRKEEGLFEYSRDGLSVYRCFMQESLIQDCEDSLRRLGTDYIDTMIIHRCPKDEEMKMAMDAMQTLKDRGLIRAVGLSNAMLGPHFEQSVELACQYGELDLLQEGASLLARDLMDRYVKICEAHNITYQTYGALEKGALAGKIIENVNEWKGDNRSGYKWFQPEGIVKLNALTKALAPIAERNNCTIPVLCLAWVLAQSECVNLLVGARKISSVADTVKVFDVKLSPEDVAEMNRLSDEANA